MICLQQPKSESGHNAESYQALLLFFISPVIGLTVVEIIIVCDVFGSLDYAWYISTFYYILILYASSSGHIGLWLILSGMSCSGPFVWIGTAVLIGRVRIRFGILIAVSIIFLVRGR